MNVIKRAQQLTANNCLVMDTETTGLGTNDEVIEIAVLNLEGDVVFESFVKPRRAKITPQAIAIHQINPARLADAPEFPALWRALASTLRMHTVVCYNAEFDRRLLRQTCAVWAERLPMGEHALETLRVNWSCLMNGYTEWNRGQRVSLTRACERHGIEPGRHSAASDALAALELLKFLAAGAPALVGLR